MPEKERLDGLTLLHAGVQACLMQCKLGLHFIFEHPVGASSWDDEEVMKLRRMEGVQELVVDQCEYGLISRDGDGFAPARKATRLLTNLSMASTVLSTRCSGSHRHVRLVNGRAAAAQSYPEKLCEVMVEALKLELQQAKAVMTIENDDDELHVDRMAGVDIEVHELDENTGKTMDPAKVKAGREKELKHFKERGVYEHVKRADARMTNGKFLKTRWVETEKGEAVRSRLVAQEFARGDPRTDLFAGTPPLFAARTLVSLAATRRRKQWTIMALDVSCAFLYADTERELYMELPAEDPKSKSGEWVGLLRRALYGTRDAPQAWLAELSRTLRSLGFVSSRLHPGVYYHPSREMMLVAHVDDLLIGGTEVDAQWVKDELAKKYDLKGSTINEAGGSVSFLGRTIAADSDGYRWAADGKHRRILLDELGLTTANGAATPLGEETRGPRDQLPELTATEATSFRASVARLNYLAQDRPDIMTAANVMSRWMSCPREGDPEVLKRTVRYLKSHPECWLEYKMQDPPGTVDVTTDSDWAGDKETRRSTSGILVQLGTHILTFSSKTQKIISLSSGEAELTAQVGGVSDGLGVRNLLEEMGILLTILSRCDSSAARGILQRTGVGKIRHLEVKHLWVQDLVKHKEVEVRWIPRAQNPADLFTHSCSTAEFRRHLEGLSVRIRIDDSSVSALRMSAAETPKGVSIGTGQSG